MSTKFLKVTLITATLIAAGCGNKSKENTASGKKVTIVLAQLSDLKPWIPIKLQASTVRGL